MARSAKENAGNCGVTVETIGRVCRHACGERAEIRKSYRAAGILAGPNGVRTAAVILNLNVMVGSVPGSGGLAYRSDDFLADAYIEAMSGIEDVKQMVKEPLKPGLDCCPGSPKALFLWEADPIYDEPSRQRHFKI